MSASELCFALLCFVRERRKCCIQHRLSPQAECIAAAPEGESQGRWRRFEGSVLLQQTDGDGQTPLDLVSVPSQREELLRSAQVRDSARTSKDKTEVLNFPLLEAGSSLLGHLIFSYQMERGLPGLTQSRSRPHTLVYELVAALEKHSLQMVTSNWTDQRAVRLAEDVETLLRFSRGEHKERLSAAVKKCRGENTVFLMETLENLQALGKALAADL